MPLIRNFLLSLHTMIAFLHLSCSGLEPFDQVIIWGHKLHSHTHSYIHNGFYRAFNYLGYPTYWFDKEDDVSNFDFSRSLFITEGQVDENIPLRNDSLYILHNCTSNKYASLPTNHRIVFQVYTDAALEDRWAVPVAPCVYYNRETRCLYMPWATDLLPEEIDANKQNVSIAKDLKQVYWVGTIGKGLYGNLDEIDPFKQACQENGIEFIHKLPGTVSLEENVQLIHDSLLAPTIVGRWQRDRGYIPCRIFKNISYGKIGLTNSRRVFELFEGQIVFNEDTHQLFYDGMERLNKITLEELIALMDCVRDKHTYLNRIDTLFDFFKLCNNE